MTKVCIFDVDGVFTDGTFYYDQNGKVFKKFGPHDADGIKMLRSLGFEILAISADVRGFEITKKRMDDMNIEAFKVGEKNRLDWIKKRGKPKDICFMGDGFFDIPALGYASLSIVPSNGVVEAKKIANFVTSSMGGSGAVFEASLKLIQLGLGQDYDDYLKELLYEKNI